jgi:hypothetical protein
LLSDSGLQGCVADFDGHGWLWLPRLPASRIAPAVEAGNHHNPLFLNRKNMLYGKPTLRFGDGSGRRQPTALDVSQLPQLWLRLPGRNVPRARDVCCRTTPALPANLHLPLGSRRPGVSRILKQARPDLLPRNYIGGILLMTGNAVIKFRPLHICQCGGVRFQAFPDRIEQFRLFLLIWSRRSLIWLQP